jgi:hypothetical protein
MSDKGPSGGGPSGHGTCPWSGGTPGRPVLVTLPVDRPAPPTPEAPSPGLRHLPGKPGGGGTDLCLRPIRSPRRECVGEVLRVATPAPQGVSRTSSNSVVFLSLVHRTPHRDPQSSPRSPQLRGPGVDQWPRPGGGRGRPARPRSATGRTPPALQVGPGGSHVTARARAGFSSRCSPTHGPRREIGEGPSSV